MSTAIGDLVVRFGAQTQGYRKGVAGVRQENSRFSQSVAKASAQTSAFNRVTSGMSQQLVGVAASFIGVSVAIAKVSQAVREVEKFNQKAANSFAIMGDLSDDMRQKMIKTAHDVAFSTKFGADEAVESYYFLASAGMDAQQQLSALPQVAKFAQAGNFNLARATDLATDAQSALGLTVKDAGTNLKNLTRVTDVLTKANTLANASMEQFSESLTNKAGAALRVVGKDIEEGAAVLGAFADQGVKGAESGTALNIVMRDLQTKALQNADAFRQAKIAVFDEAGEMRHMADIVADLERKLGGMSDAQKKATLLQLGFSDKSIVFIQMLLGTSERIREYDTELRKAGGTTQEVADKQLPALTKGLNEASAAFAELKHGILSAPLEEAGKWLQLAVASGAGGIKKMPERGLGAGVAYGGAARIRDELLSMRDLLKGRAEVAKAIEEAAQPISGKTTGMQAGASLRHLFPEKPDWLVEQIGEAVNKANTAIGELNLSAAEKTVRNFSQPLVDAGVSLRQVTELTYQFTEALNKNKEAMILPASAAATAAEQAKDLLSKWRQDVEVSGLKGRDRMIEELAGKLGLEGHDILAGLREWDHKLDELDAKTKAVQFGKNLESEFRSPAEAIRSRITEIQDMMAKFPATVTSEIGETAIAALRKQLEEEEEPSGMQRPRFAAAAGFQTQKAYSMILAATGRTDRTQEKNAKANEDNLEENKAQTALQAQMLAALDTEPIDLPG